MDYIFKINISTDGDFAFPYTPRSMEFDGCEDYELEKSYGDRDSAIKDITNICAFLKDQMHTSREYVRKDFNKMIDDFVKRLYESDDTAYTFISEHMYGNYDGTEITFQVQPHKYNLSLKLTDEEYALIRKNEKLVTIEQVKNAVLALFK